MNPRQTQKRSTMRGDDTTDRIVELYSKWQRLKKWGIADKVPNTKGTQADLDRFFADARAGKIDVTEITSVTSDVRRLEQYAQEYDEAHGGDFKREPLKTKFDIESADESLKAAKSVVDASDSAKSFLRDFLKDGRDSLTTTAKDVPWWVWAAGGTVLVTYILSQLATISRAFGGSRE